MQSYQVAVISNERTVSYITVHLQQPQANQVIVRVDSCAICTLEQRVYGGVMQRYPFAGGHEVSGIVEAIGENVSNVKIGDKVSIRLLTACGMCYYCRSGHENQCVRSFQAQTHPGLNGPGGFAQYMVVEDKNIFPLPERLDLAHAALIEPIACCVHSIENAQIRLGDDVVIVGAGVMGALHIQLAKLRGARVIVCEKDQSRLALAGKMGADILLDANACNVIHRVKELTEYRGADAVFCTAALPSAAQQSLDMVGKLGRVVFYSSIHPDEPILLNANLIHSAEINVTGSVNPNVRDFQTAVRLLAGELVDVSDLISGIYPFDQAQEAFEHAKRPDSYRIVVRCS